MFILILVLGCYTEPHPIYVADGIYQHFCLGWIIDPDIKSFFYGSLEVLFLPPHYVEMFNTNAVTSGVIVVKYGRGGLLMFLEPLFKGPWGLSYIFLIAFHPTTFIAVDDPTLFHHWIQVLGGPSGGFLIVVPPLKYTCTP